MKPRALILRTAGTNCDLETAFAFEQAGAESVGVHLNRLLESPNLLQDFQILAIPGGFSYGDDISAGKILARKLAHQLYDPLREFLGAAKPIIGICNGFQVLVKTGQLPGLPGDVEKRGSQRCTLTNNDCGHFVARWVHLACRSRSCVWLSGVDRLELPIAHGEGKFIPASDEVLRGLRENDQVALIYTRPDGQPAQGRYPDNPNGSVDDIAGICDSTGLVLGLMPHPERYVSRTQHPGWTSDGAAGDKAGELGLRLFAGAVSHVANAVGAGV